MSMKVLAADGVKIYNLSSGKSLPEWVNEKKHKKKKSSTDQQIELLQDFNFPSSCRKVVPTINEDCIVASGNYPPQIRLFDVGNLSSKVTRHIDSEIIDFEVNFLAKVLSEDFSKQALVCADRTVKFHARFGHYHQTQIPISGRNLTYVPFLAHLLVAGSTPDLHQIDLCEGKFCEPISTRLESINCTDLSLVHGLVSCAGSDGSLACIDLRQRAPAGHLDISCLLQRDSIEVTAVKFDSSGLHLSAGTSDGVVALFDLRSQHPLLIKEHMYDSPIHSLHFLESNQNMQKELTNKIASADQFVVKIWDSISGETYTNVEPTGGNCGINHLSWWKNSGLFFLGCDDPRIQSYFIPSLGTAPKWCSFLDNMTEELEEDTGHVLYDDYRFVTESELSDVGLTHLIGTDLLKAYMHGYFIHNNLYSKAKLINKPAVQTRWKETEERISSVKTVKTTKRGLTLFDEDEEIQDSRFKAVLDNPAFKIDENRDRQNDDSLLVPKDSVLINLEDSESKLDEDSLPLGERTKKPSRKKNTIKSGPREFHFVPKSGKKSRKR